MLSKGDSNSPAVMNLAKTCGLCVSDLVDHDCTSASHRQTDSSVSWSVFRASERSCVSTCSVLNIINITSFSDTYMLKKQ